MRREKTRSENIRSQLQVVNIVKELEENHKRWKQHVIRLQPQALFKNLMENDALVANRKGRWTK
jgi:hypothetical protein